MTRDRAMERVRRLRDEAIEIRDLVLKMKTEQDQQHETKHDEDDVQNIFEEKTQ